MLEEFLGRTKVAELMAKDYVDLSIDVDRMTHGKEINQRMMQGRKGGLPWMVILDADGKELATSNDAKGSNIGAPVQPDEIAHFIHMLEVSKQHMTAAELQTVHDELDAFAKPKQRPARR